MSYFRKSILLFVFMFGVFSAPYASAGLCTSIQDHLTAVVEYCKGNKQDAGGGYSKYYAFGGSCEIATSDGAMLTICSQVNPGIMRQNDAVLGYSYITNLTSYGNYCPDGANGSPCECKKGTNWQTKSHSCVKSR